MLKKITAGGAVIALGFLLVTNPVVADAAKQITGKDIKNNSITSKDIKDKTLKGKDVKDKSLTGADIKDGSLTGGDVQIRFATASTDDDAVTNTTDATVALTTSITAPSRGYLVINAGSDVYDYGTASDSSFCWIDVDGTTLDSTNRQIALDPSVNPEEDCSTGGSVVVKAGVHTVEFMAEPGQTTTTFDESNLDVLFVPFDSTGKTPSLAVTKAGKVTANR